jgi:hypothetical protein
MGQIVHANYDVCLSDWRWIIERYDLLSFVNTISSKELLIWTPADQEIDFGLFARPFTRESWAAILLMAALVITCTLMTRFAIPNTRNKKGQKIMVVTLWYFFVLLNAYYGGAMTMFFTSTNRISFNGIVDVIRAYPNWQLIYRRYSGSDIMFQLKAKHDPDYANYWARVLANPQGRDSPIFKNDS